MRTPGVRLFVLVNVVALASATGGFLLAAGLPLAARGRMSPIVFTGLVIAACALLVVSGALLLSRTVARPVTRLLETAARLDCTRSGDELPWLGESGGLALSRAALAFERIAGALDAEQNRLATKVSELTAANEQLAGARASLVRTEKLATIGRLAAGLAHEIGNPLGAITGYVELARCRLPENSDAELIDSLGRIAAAAARIDRTVRELLEFARPSSAALADVELAAVIDAALRLARVQARFRDVEVTSQVSADARRVIADEHHLAQVLLNLLLNAGDAMGGSGRVEIAVSRDGAWVLVKVADSGPGIPLEDLPRIFDPFYTTKDPGEGTGLGLAIVHRLMESFGGDVIVEGCGALGGAVFTLRFCAPRS